MNRWLIPGQLAKAGKGNKSRAGYTITEVLIVLAVSTMLFATISLYFRGRQGRAMFTQGVKNFEARLQTVMSEVTSGFYESGYTCQVTGNSLLVTPAANEPGSNKPCIFLGKVLVGRSGTVDILTVLGRRTKTVGADEVDVTSLAEANPDAIADSTSVDLTETYIQSYGLTIRRIYALTATGANGLTYGSFGFFHELGGGVGEASPLDGSRTVRLYGINTGSPVTEPLVTAANRVTGTALVPLPYGIRICLLGGNRQRAEITIGSNASQLSISSILSTGSTGACGSV